MNLSSNINLIKSGSGIPEYLAPLENQYRNLSILVLFIVTLAGGLTLAVYLFFQIQLQVLTSQKNTANRRLAAQKTKENLFLAIKSRIGLVQTIVDSNHGQSILIDNALNVANPPELESISEDQQNKIHVSYNCGSMEEAIGMTNTLISMYQQQKIKNVMMDGFSIGKDGNTISFTYVPVWN